MTWYQSYAPCCPNNPNYDPTAPTEECDLYSACDYPGVFAYTSPKSFQWVQDNSIAAFFSANGDNDLYAAKEIRLSALGKDVTVKVVDTCGDSDCGGCCTTNAQPSGYLVDPRVLDGCAPFWRHRRHLRPALLAARRGADLAAPAARRRPVRPALGRLHRWRRVLPRRLLCQGSVVESVPLGLSSSKRG